MARKRYKIDHIPDEARRRMRAGSAVARPSPALRSMVLNQGQQGTPATSNAPAPAGSVDADAAQMMALHDLAAAKNAQAPSITNDPAKQQSQLETLRRVRAALGG